jgi:pyruvate-formate lyase-activating enzyme
MTALANTWHRYRLGRARGQCSAIASRVRPLVQEDVENLSLRDVRRLLAALPLLSEHEAGSLAKWSDQRTQWLLCMRNIATALPAELTAEKVAAVRTLAGMVGTRGCVVDGAELQCLERAARTLSREEICSLFPNDAWVTNFLLSIWEYVTGEEELKSVPWNVTLPVADLCNARCIFCTSWLEGRRFLEIEALDGFEPVLRRAVSVGLVGHGEPLAHPQFVELCEKLKPMLDPRATCYTITNGFFLEKWKDVLESIPLHSYSISLNAATPETHELVMGLGKEAFAGIIRSVRHLVFLRDAVQPDMRIHITFVVTRQNIHEVAKFIDLGNELRVDEIWIRSLLPQPGLVPGLNYHTLAPTLHPEFERFRAAAKEAIARSEARVQADPSAWGTPVFSPHVQAAIDRNPPALITREQAIRDRDLRTRNLFLYQERGESFRGRPKPSSSFARVVKRDDRVSVQTPAQHGAYAASISLEQLREQLRAGKQCTLQTRVDNVHGDVGIGVVGADKSRWVARGSVSTGGSIKLTVPPDEEAAEIVVFKGGATPDHVSCDVVGIELLPDDERMGKGQRVSFDGLALQAHNLLDPLDDGLNPLGREPRFACKAVYYNLYINELFLRINPCCYMQSVPGYEEIRYDKSVPFMEAWNSPAMVGLRRRLREGPLYGACRKCPEKW